MSNLIVTAALSTFFLSLFGVSWDKLDEKISTEFPGVKVITTQQLHDGLQDAQAPAALFDVREPEEFAVSRIEHALNLGTAEQIAAVIVDRAAPIIVYCSVGYRSAGVAERLQELGFTNVLNLQHSLFEWANNGYPMVNAMGRTTRVHPFNRAWGALVAESLHSYQP